MIAKSDLTAVILGGGKIQKETGRSPSTFEVDGRKVIERQAQLLKAKASRIEVSVSAPVSWSRFPATIDDFDPIGPLAGIATALQYASTDYILVVHGGYAWIRPEALDFLVGRAGDPFDACAVRIGFATPKPLFAIYHKRVAKKAAARIERGEHDAGGFLTDGLAVRWIEDYEFEAVDPGMTTFKVAGGEPEPAAPASVEVVTGAPAEGGVFPFQAFEHYQAAMGFLPLAYALAKPADAELGGQLVRAALAITTRIAEASGRDERDRLLAARGSALECAAALDALRALGSTDAKIAEGHAALFRIVSLLTTKLS